MTKTLISTPIVVPEAVRRKAGIRRGEAVEFKVSGRAITIAPKAKRVPSAGATLTPEEAQLKRGIRQSLKEFQQGKVVGPFLTADEFIADLHRESAKLGVKKTVKRVGS